MAGSGTHSFLQNKRSGFTLVEVAIVVVVIALLIGGIVVGQSLIRDARVMSVISDVNRFKQAAKLFRDKYNYLPGDLPSAATFWGALADCSDGAPSAVRTRSTCNGNGDGFIGGLASVPDTINGATALESLRVWQHLSNAGMIAGTYTGSGSPAADDGLDPGLNIPEGQIAGSGFTLHYAPASYGNTGFFDGNYGHIIVFGRTSGYYELAQTSVAGIGLNRPAYLPALTSQEASSIDRKIDDGKPGTGGVRSYTYLFLEAVNCATESETPTTAEYKTDPAAVPIENSFGWHSEISCALIFITGL